LSVEDQAFNDLANLVYDAALINSGFPSVEPHDFAGRIHRVVSMGLGVDPEIPLDNAEPSSSKKDAEEDLHEEL